MSAKNYGLEIEKNEEIKNQSSRFSPYVLLYLLLPFTTIKFDIIEREIKSVFFSFFANGKPLRARKNKICYKLRPDSFICSFTFLSFDLDDYHCNVYIVFL